MWKSLGIAATLAFCIAGSPLNAQSSDGPWSGTAYVHKSSGCGADAQLQAELRNGRLQGHAQFPAGSPKIDWTVAGDGTVSGEGMEGKISGGALSGSWSRSGRAGQCTYRVEMKRG